MREQQTGEVMDAFIVISILKHYHPQVSSTLFFYYISKNIIPLFF